MINLENRNIMKALKLSILCATVLLFLGRNANAQCALTIGFNSPQCGDVMGTWAFTPNDTPIVWIADWDDGNIDTLSDQSSVVIVNHTYAVPGTYMVTAIATANNGSGCTDTSSMPITISSTGFTVTSTFTNVSCYGGNDGTACIVASGGTPPYYYQWNTGSTASCEYNLSAGAYYVTVTDASGCNAYVGFFVNQPTQIIADAGADQYMCPWDTIQFNACSPIGGTAPYTYSWLPAMGLNWLNICNPTASMPFSVTYTLTVTDANGCADDDIVELVADSAYCSPCNTTIGFNSPSCGFLLGTWVTSSQNTPITWWVNWGDGNSETLSDTTSVVIAQHQYSGTGIFDVTVWTSDAHGCMDTVISTQTINMNLVVDAGPDVTICNGSSIALDGCNPVGGTAPFNFSWQGQGLSDFWICNPIASPTVTTTYTLMVSDASGCYGSDYVTVFVSSQLLVNADDIIICSGDTGQFNGVVTGGTAPYFYLWNTFAYLSDSAISNPFVYPPISLTYQLFVTDVNGCSGFDAATTVFIDQECVWPGDANDDGLADNLDVLNIGIAYNSNGPLRDDASLIWDDQACYDWSNDFANGANYKHADTEGTGTVNDDDTLAITLNYGMTHPRLANPNNQAQGNMPPLYFQIPTDSLFAGDTVYIPVMLGDSIYPVNNIYGIAFSLFCDTTIVEAGSGMFSCASSWMGTMGNDLLCFNYDLGNGQLDVAQTRTNQQNISGYGQIGTQCFVMKDDISGKDFYDRMLHLSTGNIYAINVNEQTLDIEATNDSVTVYMEETGVGEIDFDAMIEIYPNPASQWAVISWQSVGKEKAELIISNSVGQIIYSAKLITSNVRLQTSNWENGIYFLTIYFENQTVNRKISVVH